MLVFRPAFRCTQHPKADQNTQHLTTKICCFCICFLCLQICFENFQFYNLGLIFFNFRIDSSDDNRISKEEFTSDAIKSSIEKWVGPIDDWEAEFDKIDTNNGGQILFKEFVDWALEKNLDLEDDIDVEVIYKTKRGLS